MTDQISGYLINELDPDVFHGLHIYRVVTGDISDNGYNDDYKYNDTPAYEYETVPLEVSWMSTNNYKGYERTFKLDKHGYLYLWSLGRANPSSYKEDEPLEKLKGDFWLVLKKNFTSSSTCVPFKNGKLVSNEDYWYQQI